MCAPPTVQRGNADPGSSLDLKVRASEPQAFSAQCSILLFLPFIVETIGGEFQTHFIVVAFIYGPLATIFIQVTPIFMSYAACGCRGVRGRAVRCSTCSAMPTRGKPTP